MGNMMSKVVRFKLPASCNILNNPKGGIKEKMKRYRRSKKALSPVIATIILIAVTVAVSIAVAVWMGALTTGFMANEQLTITSANFVVTPGNVTLSVSNTGTTTVTITQVWNGNTPIAGATFAGLLVLQVLLWQATRQEQYHLLVLL